MIVIALGIQTNIADRRIFELKLVSKHCGLSQISSFALDLDLTDEFSVEPR